MMDPTTFEQHLHNPGRRTTLAALAGAGLALRFIPAWNETVEAADTCVPATPTVTEGPYWVDEKLFRSDIRTDTSNGIARAGTPLALVINLQNMSNGGCGPLVGAYVDIWHCDAKGIYSDEPTYNPGGGTGTVNTKGQTFLRGYQVTDANGQVRFTTIYPGWYSGRTIHIHVRVRTYSGATVIGNFVSQVFFDETTNDTVLAQPAYARSTRRDTTNATDMVYRVANPERMLATTTGNLQDGYASTITMGVSLQVAASAPPTIASGGIANAVSGAAGIAPGAWISIYGSNFSTETKTLASADIVNDALPTTLGGVSVTINGKAAYVQYVSASQVNVLVPSDVGTGSVAVTVKNSVGTSSAVNATVSQFLPGLSTASNYVRAVRYPDGAVINGTGAAESGYKTSAAVAQGEIVALYGTGFGPAQSAPSAGALFTGAYQTANPVTVTVGGVEADVLWAGLVGPGLYQLNIRVPSTIPDGDQPVTAMVGGATTQSTGLLKVAASAKLASGGVSSSLAARMFLPAPGTSFLPLKRGAPKIERVMALGGLRGPEHRAGADRVAARHRAANCEVKG